MRVVFCHMRSLTETGRDAECAHCYCCLSPLFLLPRVCFVACIFLVAQQMRACVRMCAYGYVFVFFVSCNIFMLRVCLLSVFFFFFSVSCFFFFSIQVLPPHGLLLYVYISRSARQRHGGKKQISRHGKLFSADNKQQ